MRETEFIRPNLQVDILKAPRVLDRIEGVRLLTAEVGKTHSVLGWVEGPMAEYSDLRGVETTLMDLMDRPGMFLEAGEILVEKAIAFAREQVKAGADMIGVGDAAASLIGPDLYSQFVLPLETKLIAGIHNAGATVKLHICGNVTPPSSTWPNRPTSSTAIGWLRLEKPASMSAITCAATSILGVLVQAPQTVAPPPTTSSKAGPSSSCPAASLAAARSQHPRLPVQNTNGFLKC
jgi:uroporphyrinogen-III decarboxylase